MVLGRAIGIRCNRALKHKDIAVGHRFADVVKRASIAQPQFEHRTCHCLRQRGGMVDTRTL